MATAERLEPAPKKDLNIVALLSLQLLLLAFFILLNSLSKFEDQKTRRVLVSVNDAFNGRVRALANAPGYSGAVGNLDDTQSLAAELGELFEVTIPAVKLEQSEQARVFRLEMPAETLFQPGTVELRPGRLRLIKRLSEALTRRQDAGLDFQLRLFYGVASTAAQRFAAPRPTLLEIQRSSRLVEELEARGVEASRLSLGVEPGRPGRMAFEISLRDAAGAG